MHLTEMQTAAVSAIQDWLADPDRKSVFKLFGYAGTGKTTAISTALADYTAAYCAFTGKAASVMRRQGLNATTLHSLIYDLERVEEDEDGKNRTMFFSVKNPEDLRHIPLIVLDECSMIDQKTARDLLSFGIPILAIGDPAQLPPINDTVGVFSAGTPDVVLTEVHRQAKNSPVLSMATKVRRGVSLPFGQAGDSSVVFADSVTDTDLWTADQVIVGTNATRARLNARARKYFGMTAPIPMFGDKIICTRNNYKYGMFNGEMFTVMACEPTRSSHVLNMNLVRLEDPNNTIIEDVPVLARGFAADAPRPPQSLERSCIHADYGYAITCHKAQGSQWPHVLVVDESRVFRDNTKEWLYTAITRAADAITVVRGKL